MARRKPDGAGGKGSNCSDGGGGSGLRGSSGSGAAATEIAERVARARRATHRLNPDADLSGSPLSPSSQVRSNNEVFIPPVIDLPRALDDIPVASAAHLPPPPLPTPKPPLPLPPPPMPTPMSFASQPSEELVRPSEVRSSERRRSSSSEGGGGSGDSGGGDGGGGDSGARGLLSSGYPSGK